MTTTALDSYLAALDAFRHRLLRLADDLALLSDRMTQANAGPTVDRWAAEVSRIELELAGSLEVLERTSDAASCAETALLDPAAFADDE